MKEEENETKKIELSNGGVIRYYISSDGKQLLDLDDIELVLKNDPSFKKKIQKEVLNFTKLQKIKQFENINNENLSLFNSNIEKALNWNPKNNKK